MEQSYNPLYMISIPKYINILIMEGTNEYKSTIILHDWCKINYTLGLSLIDKLIILRSLNFNLSLSNQITRILEVILLDLINLNRSQIIYYFSILYNLNSHLLFLDLLNMLVNSYNFSTVLNEEQIFKLKENIALILDVFMTSSNSKQINVDNKSSRINLSVRCMDRMERMVKTN